MHFIQNVIILYWLYSIVYPGNKCIKHSSWWHICQHIYHMKNRWRLWSRRITIYLLGLCRLYLHICSIVTFIAPRSLENTCAPTPLPLIYEVWVIQKGFFPQIDSTGWITLTRYTGCIYSSKSGGKKEKNTLMMMDRWYEQIKIM